MTWLVLRLHRRALLLTAGLAALAVVVYATGRLLSVDALLAGGLPQSCLTDATRDCQRQAGAIVRDQAGADGLSILGSFWGVGHALLVALPLALGVLNGAGLFSRELDQGTHLLTLTQNVGRTRWFATRLLLAAGTAVAAALVVSAVANWANAPLDRVAVPQPRLVSPILETSGISPAGYTLLAVAVAAVVGMLTRSAPTAAIATTVVFATAMIALVVVARPGYLPPLTARAAVPADLAPSWEPVHDQESWVLDRRYVDEADRTVSAFAVQDAYLQGRCPPLDDAACLRQVGVVTVESSYHPPARFWPFQLIETAILLVLAGAAVAAGALRLRRSLAP